MGRAAQAARAGRDEGYEAVDYGLTMVLYHAAALSGGSPRFIYLSSAGVRESHVHDVQITKEAPNYHID